MEESEAIKVVTLTYMGVLRRPPTPAELENFTAALVKDQPVSQLLEIFVGCDEFKQLTSVKLFAPPGHFYSPIVFPPEAERHMATVRGVVSASVPEVHIDHAQMVKLFNEMIPYIAEFPFPHDVTTPFRYATNNGNFGYGDACILFAMLRIKRPKHLIEIGSGWSSACSLDTVQRYLGGDCSMLFVEPYPRLLRDLIGDASLAVTILETPVQLVPLETFDILEAGDILFIDSTHVLRTGSDVCFELFEILPRLKPGVIVHIHDMFWPFEYPEAWVLQDNRSWNELYAVRALLMGNANWRVIYFNEYIMKTEPDLVQRAAPRILENGGGGLWLERTAA